MRKYWLLVAVMVLGAVLLTGCRKAEESGTGVTSEEVKEEAKEALETTLAYTEQKKEEYQKQIDAKLKEYDRRIEELEQRAKEMKKQAREELDEELRALKAKRQELALKIEETRTASGKAWEDLRKGADEAMEDIDRALDRASKHFE